MLADLSEWLKLCFPTEVDTSVCNIWPAPDYHPCRE